MCGDPSITYPYLPREAISDELLIAGGIIITGLTVSSPFPSIRPARAVLRWLTHLTSCLALRSPLGSATGSVSEGSAPRPLSGTATFRASTRSWDASCLAAASANRWPTWPSWALAAYGRTSCLCVGSHTRRSTVHRGPMLLRSTVTSRTLRMRPGVCMCVLQWCRLLCFVSPFKQANQFFYFQEVFFLRPRFFCDVHNALFSSEYFLFIYLLAF